jgi:hypothetical protein
MKVNVCIASRGRYERLADTIARVLSNSVLPDTQVSIALDDDDPSPLPRGTIGGTIAPDLMRRYSYSIAPREDSLGAKYNRAAELYDADLYVLWSDDVYIPTGRWDEILADYAVKFEDGMGVVYFGKLEGVFQPGIAVTRGFIDRMGFFCTPYFPFWWHDTWIDEIARMSGRIIHAPVDCTQLSELKGQSRGVREIAWWAAFFEATRPMRRKVAEGIIEAGSDQPYRKLQLRQQLSGMEKLLVQRNSGLLDPQRAAQLESFYSFDAPADERYQRVKAKAQAMLDEIKGVQAAA